jgi:hypothetical protein
MVPDENHYTYEHLVEVNSLGLRGPEIAENKSPGERRILALGDSMIYGQGVGQGSTLPAHLERELNESEELANQTRWTVINGGHRAYATNQELGLLRELGSQLVPDIVILFWYDNDFEEYDLAETFAELKRTGPRTFDVGDTLEGWTLVEWRIKQVLRRSALVMIAHDRLRDGLEKPKDEQFYEEGFATLGLRLDEFVEMCAAIEARPALAVIPVASTLVADNKASQRATRVKELAASKEIEVIDLHGGLQSLVEELGSLPTLPYDGHYQGLANLRMARILSRSIASD